MARGKRNRYVALRPEKILPNRMIKEVWPVGDRKLCKMVAFFETEQEARDKAAELNATLKKKL